MMNSPWSDTLSEDKTSDQGLCSVYDSNYYTDIRTVSDTSKTTIIDISANQSEDLFTWWVFSFTIIILLHCCAPVTRTCLGYCLKCRFWLGKLAYLAQTVTTLKLNSSHFNTIASIHREKWNFSQVYIDFCVKIRKLQGENQNTLGKPIGWFFCPGNFTSC